MRDEKNEGRAIGGSALDEGGASAFRRWGLKCRHRPVGRPPWRRLNGDSRDKCRRAFEPEPEAPSKDGLE